MNSVAFNVIFLIIAIFLVVKGGDYFVSSAVSLAKKTKIPEVVIGATIVSIATTLPEVIVSVTAAINNQYDMSVGNGIGTVIANVALICGLSITIAPLTVKKGSNLKYIILLFVCAFLVIASINKKIDLYESIILLVVFVAFMIINVIDGKRQMNKYPQEHDEDVTENHEGIMPWKKIIPLFLLGALAIGFGAVTMVETASNLAKMIGISDEIIALTIMALGTSLPELTTTIISIRKKQSALGYGNIIGANIINATLLMGLSGAIAGKNGLSITNQSLFVNIPLALLLNAMFVLPLIIKHKTYRWQGIIMLLIYFAYMVFLILSTLGIVVV